MFCEALFETQYKNKEELLEAFIYYIVDKIQPINERKAVRILDVLKNINCLKCFDIKCLITERKYLSISSLDCNGTFDLIKCDFCSDGSIIKPTKYFKEKRHYKTLRYAKMIFVEDIAEELYFLSLKNDFGEPEWEFAENEYFNHKITKATIDIDITPFYISNADFFTPFLI